jgi:hypothetical protein
MLAQETAIVSIAAVGGIIDPAQPVALGIGGQIRVAKSQQRPNQPTRAKGSLGGHSGEPVDACAAQYP